MSALVLSNIRSKSSFLLAKDWKFTIRVRRGLVSLGFWFFVDGFRCGDEAACGVPGGVVGMGMSEL